MGFSSGSITFKRFAVQGKAPARVDEGLLKQLASRAITADSIRTADRTQLGWTTGQHMLDTAFDFEKNAIADGLHFALRIDTNKAPTDLVRSYQKINELAMLEASGRPFLSKPERREAREQALSRADQEAESGAFRRTKLVPVFWDLKRKEVYLGATGSTVADQFMLLFRETFDHALVPLSASELAARWAGITGEARAFDDCRPAYFINPPEGAGDSSEGAAPGDARGKDFLGTEWLTWLWYASQVESPQITTGQGHSVTVLFEKSLQLECAFKMTGTVTVQSEGPTELPESAVALAGGKCPVRAGLQIAVHADVFGLAIRGDAMHHTAVQLPPPEEIKNERAVFEERIEHLRDMIEAIGELYVAFLKRRLSGKWSGTLNAMRNWIATGRHNATPTRSAEAV